MAFNAGEITAKVTLDASEFKKNIADVRTGVETLSSTAKKIGQDLIGLGAKLSIAVGIPATILAKQSVDSAVEIENAWKRVQKVYDGTAESVANELTPAARRLALEFGKNKLEVVGVMEELAAMGNVGPQLIDKTRQALHFATNGGLELNEGLKAVVATSAILGVEGEELTKQLAKMNKTENAGAATMGDLAIAMNTVGNVSKVSGVTIDELNGFMSVLVKRGVESSEAANGLKTIFTRLRRPMEEAQTIMDKYNITLGDSQGNLKDADEVLNDIAESWGKMTEAEREEMAFSVGTMFQKDKFLALMDDLNSSNSEYVRILQEQADETDNLNTYNRELQIFLDQSSTKIEQFNVKWQEAKEVIGALIVQVLLPLLEKLGQLLEWFMATPSWFQKFITAMILIGVVIGPVLIGLGVFLTLLPAIGTAIMAVVGIFIAMGATMVAIGAPILALITIIGLLIGIGIALYLNWDYVKQRLSDAWDSIVAKFNEGVTNAQKALINLQNYIASKVNEFREWGRNLGGAFVDGVRDKLNGLVDAAKGALNKAKDILKGNSPPKAGPFREIDKWGENIGVAWVDGIKKGIESLNTSVLSQSLVGANMTGGGGSTVINQNINANLSNQLDVNNLSERLGFEMLRRI
jgi:TP901 family phage tail tape measure protein